ncbi:MAG: polysaccharide biosynthesis protein [Lachnospiraceae bacterium]|nr:polysaccharide biosynthesis protein [Lachnospiraceae bacterium]
MGTFTGKTLMITGGTGSFGNAVLDRFLDTDIGEIRIFSRDEKKQDDMRKKYKNDKIRFYIGDVREKQSVVNAINGVDFIFHAAALKQVPSCEFFPMEAVKTNIIGTNNVLEAAVEASVKKIVCLSTDKAAYPINAMGISKAMMEKVIIAKARTLPKDKTTICVTRYGNVICSRGSVIPLFIDQIKSGQPLTVTNPNMTRFLMDLKEAVDLVLYAFENGDPGDLFVRKSPASTIGDLAEAVRELFDPSARIHFIGIRHGEKMSETLMTAEEYSKAEDLGEYFRIPVDARDLNYEKYYEDGNTEIRQDESFTSDNTSLLSVEEIKELLLKQQYVKERICQ